MDRTGLLRWIANVAYKIIIFMNINLFYLNFISLFVESITIFIIKFDRKYLLYCDSGLIVLIRFW